MSATSDGSTAGSRDGRGLDEAPSASSERALLDAAIEFYGAAEQVIDVTAAERPRVRRGAAGFEAVQRATAALEERVVQARDAGMSADRIARITRIEQETIDLILERRDAAPSRGDG